MSAIRTSVEASREAAAVVAGYFRQDPEVQRVVVKRVWVTPHDCIFSVKAYGEAKPRRGKCIALPCLGAVSDFINS